MQDSEGSHCDGSEMPQILPRLDYQQQGTCDGDEAEDPYILCGMDTDLYVEDTQTGLQPGYTQLLCLALCQLSYKKQQKNSLGSARREAFCQALWTLDGLYYVQAILQLNQKTSAVSAGAANITPATSTPTTCKSSTHAHTRVSQLPCGSSPKPCPLHLVYMRTALRFWIPDHSVADYFHRLNYNGYFLTTKNSRLITLSFLLQQLLSTRVLVYHQLHGVQLPVSIALRLQVCQSITSYKQEQSCRCLQL